MLSHTVREIIVSSIRRTVMKNAINVWNKIPASVRDLMHLCVVFTGLVLVISFLVLWFDIVMGFLS